MVYNSVEHFSWKSTSFYTKRHAGRQLQQQGQKWNKAH